MENKNSEIILNVHHLSFKNRYYFNGLNWLKINNEDIINKDVKIINFVY